MNPTRRAISKYLIDFRKRRGMGQPAFALALGTSQSRLSRTERGEADLTVSQILNLCDHFKARLLSQSDHIIQDPSEVIEDIRKLRNAFIGVDRTIKDRNRGNG